jgi:hypothetical protein
MHHTLEGDYTILVPSIGILRFLKYGEIYEIEPYKYFPTKNPEI